MNWETRIDLFSLLILHIPEEDVATHSSVLAWGSLWMREAWWATSQWGHRESDTIEATSLTGTILCIKQIGGFPGSSAIKSLPANAGVPSSIPWMGRSPGRGYDNPLQYSC